MNYEAPVWLLLCLSDAPLLHTLCLVQSSPTVVYVCNIKEVLILAADAVARKTSPPSKQTRLRFHQAGIFFENDKRILLSCLLALKNSP